MCMSSATTAADSSSSSGNIFQDALSDVKGLETRLLGEAYPYTDNIRTPSELGMSSKGSMSVLGKDIKGLTNYVELLVAGTGSASKTGKPLGNRFFLQTGGKCTDPDGSEQDRYIYVDNIPNGSIPFISSAMGVNFSSFKGLVPGIMTDLEVLNPMKLIQAFMVGSKPDCREVTLETVDTHNVHGTDTHYVATVDLQGMSACEFQDRRNPVTGEKCRETFAMLNSGWQDPSDPIARLFVASLGVGALYVLWRLMKKRKFVP